MIPGVDFSKYPQIMAAPPVPSPADYIALTRMLAAPSVREEPFDRARQIADERYSEAVSRKAHIDRKNVAPATIQSPRAVR